MMRSKLDKCHGCNFCRDQAFNSRRRRLGSTGECGFIVTTGSLCQEHGKTAFGEIDKDTNLKIRGLIISGVQVSLSFVVFMLYK